MRVPRVRQDNAVALRGFGHGGIKKHFTTGLLYELGRLAHNSGFYGLTGVTDQAHGADGFILFQSKLEIPYFPWGR